MMFVQYSTVKILQGTKQFRILMWENIVEGGVQKKCATLLLAAGQIFTKHISN